jgi:transcription initiation factor TFIIIB Brf1 subunit/transcription initiation factor TFIIB
MDDLAIFNLALSQEKAIKKDPEDPEEPEEYIEEKECLHLSTIKKGGISVCENCHAEVETFSHEQEWRFYSDQSHNPNRCHPRKDASKNIYGDVDGFDFPQSIVTKANEIYFTHTKGFTKRGKNRRSIILACVFYAYKHSGKPRNIEQLQQIFELSKKRVSRGMKDVSITIRQNSLDKPTYITPYELIPDIMKKFNAKSNHIEEVQIMYSNVRNKSSLIKRSKPKSVASSIAYYYIRKTGRNITIKEFTEKVILSELTIDKLVKEITLVLNTN